MNTQIIEKNGQPEWAVIPYREFIKIQEILDDAEDINDLEENLRAIAEKQEIIIPGEVTFAIIDGTHPIRAWRKYKKINIKELAKTVGISGSYLSQIETGKKNLTIETLKDIAKAVEIDVEMLIS